MRVELHSARWLNVNPLGNVGWTEARAPQPAAALSLLRVSLELIDSIVSKRQTTTL